MPFGRLADRVSRRDMIGFGLATWSIASAATGWMHSFEGLFLCRVLVGIGEATLAPAALSLLTDLFPRAQRATAAALYSAGVPVGAGLALWLGGGIGEAWGWRPAFLVLGLPGLLLAAGVRFLPDRRGPSDREPLSPTISERSSPSVEVAFDSAGRRPRAAVLQDSNPGGAAAALARPAWWLQVGGYAVFAIATNALPMWVPALLRARFGLGLAEVGAWMGGCALVGGLLGSALGGVLADGWQQRTPAGRARFGAVASGLAAVAWAVLLSAGSFPLAIGAVFALMALGLAWLGPAAADVQELAGPAHRGLAVGVYLFAVNALGHGFGPPLLGWLNDRVGAAADPEALATSLLLAPAVSALAASLLWAAGRSRVATAAR